MELRKQKEIEYYDKKAIRQLNDFSQNQPKNSADFEGFSPFLLESYKFLSCYLKDKKSGKIILDYGCGNGIHSFWLAQDRGEVIGIDLSEKSLQFAEKRRGNRVPAGKIKFLSMDCEDLKFPSDYFDIVFDGGTFSSLDFKKVYPEISRVLKPDGFLIGIETLGHHPLANLKRMFNKLFGKRTEWAAEHIVKINDLKEARKYFKKQEIYFFHLTSCLVFPFLNIAGARFILKFFEGLDKIIISLFPFLKKYCFKAVFIFSYPC